MYLIRITNQNLVERQKIKKKSHIKEQQKTDEVDTNDIKSDNASRNTIQKVTTVRHKIRN